MQSSALFKRRLVLESLLHPAAWSMDQPTPPYSHDVPTYMKSFGD